MCRKHTTVPSNSEILKPSVGQFLQPPARKKSKILRKVLPANLHPINLNSETLPGPGYNYPTDKILNSTVIYAARVALNPTMRLVTSLGR